MFVGVDVAVFVGVFVGLTEIDGVTVDVVVGVNDTVGVGV